LVSATENASYANLPVNANLTGQLRFRNRPLRNNDKTTDVTVSYTLHSVHVYYHGNHPEHTKLHNLPKLTRDCKHSQRSWAPH